MKYFNIEVAELSARGAIHTAQEISEQPSVWESTYKKVLQEQIGLAEFLNTTIERSKKIILTGAGTSAYIGYSLEGVFQRNTGVTTISIPTTHLVTHPEDYFQANVPTLLVSFARSGNSPESVAAAKLADIYCNNCNHLVITCDLNGELAKYKSLNNKYCFILPPEANDKSLAMTGSYTSMILAGLLIARINEIDSLKKQVDIIVMFSKHVINNFVDKIKEISALDFERAVFLGSGPFFGTATESHLKLQELTDGRIICKNDSFLAFRHGPKAVVDEKTIVFYIFSNTEYVQHYEIDLVKAMQNENKAMKLIGVSASPKAELNLDFEIFLSDTNTEIEDEFLSVCHIIPAQMLGFFKSLEFGLKPDSPSISGTITRVVEGVVIYEPEIQCQ